MTGSFQQRTFFPVSVCVALAACGGITTRSSAPAPATAVPGEQRVPLYVVKRGWHVDVGLALADVQPPLLPLAAAFHDSRYLLFGFGDRRYLLHGGAANLTAALWGGAGLVLVTSLPSQPPEDVFGSDSVVRVTVTAQQMGALQRFIADTLATHDGAPVRVTPDPRAPGAYDAYYESVQHYSALHTCNTWAAQALQSARLPVSSSGVEFAWQLWEQVQRLELAGAELPVAPARAP